MATLDANTKVSIGSLVTLLGLGIGGIWKIADIDKSIATGNTELAAVKNEVRALNDNMKAVVPMSVFELWKAAQSARDQAQDSRMDRFDRLLDHGEGQKGR